MRRGKPATANRKLAALRAVFAWAARVGVVHASPAAITRDVPQVRPGPRAADRQALGALLRAAQQAGSVRDVALITLLAQAGLGISEALALRWADVTLRERSGQVTVRRGKGGKYREVPLTLTARKALSTWRLSGWGGGAPARDEPVFPGRGGRPLTSRAAQLAFARHSRQAGVPTPVTPHTLRHTFCKSLVDAGESLDRVATLAGHASLNTTARYTRPTAADLERAVSRLEWA